MQGGDSIFNFNFLEPTFSSCLIFVFPPPDTWAFELCEWDSEENGIEMCVLHTTNRE